MHRRLACRNLRHPVTAYHLTPVISYMLISGSAVKGAAVPAWPELRSFRRGVLFSLLFFQYLEPFKQHQCGMQLTVLGQQFFDFFVFGAY